VFTTPQISDETLRQELHLDTNKALAGVLSGVSKAVKRIGIPVEVIQSSFKRNGKDRIYPGFLIACTNVGRSRLHTGVFAEKLRNGQTPSQRVLCRRSCRAAERHPNVLTG